MPINMDTGFQAGLASYSISSPRNLFQITKVSNRLAKKLAINNCNKGIEVIIPDSFLITITQAIERMIKTGASFPLPTSFKLYENNMHPSKGDRKKVLRATAFFE